MKSLSQERLQTIYFSALLLVFGVLSFTVLSNFLIVLGLAYIAAILLLPIYERIVSHVSTQRVFKKFASTFAASCTVLLLILLIITPITLILGKVFTDAQQFYSDVTTSGVSLDSLSLSIQEKLSVYVPDIKQRLDTAASAVSGFFVQNIGNFFSGTFDIVLKVFLFLLALFYFLKDKSHFVKMYRDLSPLSESDDISIFNSIKQAVRSIMLGSMVVAVAQGVATGIGFAIFGVPNPFFLGSIAGFMALVPGIGPALVWIPAAIYLYVTGGDTSFAWLGQVIWGVGAVGLIDNFLGPLVINKGIQIHPLFILLSILGGIAIFGPEGFLFGPLVLSVFVSIATVWRAKTESQL
ncbi:MAG: AI-2E family transporter [Patescibacteria group bacterium]